MDAERIARTLRHTEWRDELLRTGLRGKSGNHIDFSRVEPLAGTRWLHADAETKGKVQDSEEEGDYNESEEEQAGEEGLGDLGGGLTYRKIKVSFRGRHGCVIRGCGSA